jgi:hypothetical protein
MFWKKKKTKTPKQALILQTYLAGSTLLLEGRTISPAAKAGIQVFILGMADKLRQAENLNWEEFIAVYSSTLSQYKILPSRPVAKFIDHIGSLASTDVTIAEVMKMGAQSITMYVSQRDADAPTDLLNVPPIAEQFKGSFERIV